MSAYSVEVIDYGLATLDQDVENRLRMVLGKSADDLRAQMQANIAGRGDTDAFFDTGATANSVIVESPDQWARDVGPTTRYAIYGEEGWWQWKAWGHEMLYPIPHPPIRFARAALDKIRDVFLDAIRAALAGIGKSG